MENLTKRRFLTFLTATVFAPLLSAATSDFTPPTQEESFAITAMRGMGLQDFVIMNKRSGQLHLVKDGDVFLTTPAISGKTKGDKIRDDGMVTPAGLHTLQPFGDEDILYKRDGHSAYLIHSTSPARQKRFSSRDVNNLRASAGCIGVPSVVLPVIRAAIEPKNGHSPVFLVVLPDFGSIRDYLAMPENSPENPSEPSP